MKMCVYIVRQLVVYFIKRKIIRLNCPSEESPSLEEWEMATHNCHHKSAQMNVNDNNGLPKTEYGGNRVEMSNRNN